MLTIQSASAALILAVLSTATDVGTPSASFRIEFEPPPIRATQAELVEFLQRVHDLVNDANGNVEGLRVDEEFSLSREGTTITVDGEPESMNQFGTLKKIDSMTYVYWCSSAPITSLQITLSTRYRTVEIKGERKDQVLAVKAFVQDWMTEHSMWFAGMTARFMIALLLVVLIQLAYGLIERRRGSFPKELWWLVCLLPGIGLGIFVGLSRSFPNVRLYSDDASFFDRYGGFFSFLGVIATIITFVLGSYLTLRLTKPSAVPSGKNPTPVPRKTKKKS